MTLEGEKKTFVELAVRVSSRKSLKANLTLGESEVSCIPCEGLLAIFLRRARAWDLPAHL